MAGWTVRGHHVGVAAFSAGLVAQMIVVLGYGHDDDAYREAAREAKAGLRIETVEVEAWKAEDHWHCPVHPKGPPWWRSNGGNGKRPSQWPPAKPVFGQP